MAFSSHPRPSGATVPGSALIRLEGADALGLLHRISTQSLADLEPGQARTTLFCDFRGRLFHRAVVGVTRDRSVWVMRDDAPGEELVDWIGHHVFREDVRVTDASGAQTVRAAPGGVGLSGGSLAERHGVPSAVQVSSDFGFWVDPDDPPPGEPAPGAPTPGNPTPGVLQIERARILAGRPRHGHEVGADYTPFEVGLAHEVHLAKGCFTGQEALMRLVTYRGVRRRLARVGGAGAAPTAPSAVRLGEEKIGILTSAAASDDRWVGLAVLKHQAFDPAMRLEVDGAGPIEVPLAFPETRPLGLP